MKNIPKEFNLMGRKWKVIFDNIRGDYGHFYGQCDYNKLTIYLCSKSNNEILPDDLIMQTFLHELTHAILYTMSENDLNKNEQFVDIFSGLLHQSLKNKI